MDEIVCAIQNVVADEPETETQADSAQPGDVTIETQLSQEISTLWSDHVRLSTDRKVTAKELRQLRARLAERLHEMKSLLSRPGRGGQWRSWLRERSINRSTADRLVARHAETLCNHEEDAPSGAISSSPEDSAEKVAKGVWQRFRKVLDTQETVLQFIGCIAAASGVRHEWREEGLMIFHAASKPANGVTSTGVSAEAACPAPLPAEGDGHPAESPATETNPQLLDDGAASAQETPEEPTATPKEPVQATAVEAGESKSAL